jgi:hypothetical protein
MSLRADTLKSNEAQKRAINVEVRQILEHIDDKLKIEREDGTHGISVTVPIMFSIPYMSNKNAQRIIYYKILKSLLDRGFEVKIKLEEKKSTFLITWVSAEELAEIEEQNALLAQHMANPDI